MSLDKSSDRPLKNPVENTFDGNFIRLASTAFKTSLPYLPTISFIEPLYASMVFSATCFSPFNKHT